MFCEVGSQVGVTRSTSWPADGVPGSGVNKAAHYSTSTVGLMFWLELFETSTVFCSFKILGSRDGTGTFKSFASGQICPQTTHLIVQQQR